MLEGLNGDDLHRSLLSYDSDRNRLCDDILQLVFILIVHAPCLFIAINEEVLELVLWIHRCGNSHFCTLRHLIARGNDRRTGVTAILHRQRTMLKWRDGDDAGLGLLNNRLDGHI